MLCFCAYNCSIVEKKTAVASHVLCRRRIAINAQLLAQEQGYRRAGVSRYIDNLIGHLLQADPEGDYTVFVSDRSALSLSPRQGSGQAIRQGPGQAYRQRRSRLPMHNPWVRIYWEQCLLPLEIRAQSIKLLHSPVNVQPFFLPCKGVVTVTDLSFMIFPESFKTLQRFYQRFFTHLSARRADHLIAISNSTARDLSRFFGVLNEKITVTYPGVDATYQPTRDSSVLAEFRRRRNLPEQFFLFVGTLEPRKNLEMLLQAYAAFLRSAKSRYKLVLGGGKGWLYRSLFAAVEKLGLRSEVIFPGFIAEDELPLWYNAADVFVYPSLYEGFGLPPLEAMACGTPVIASRTSSLPEVVGDAGLLLDPDRPDEWAEAFSRLCEDAHLRAELVARGLQQAQRFSWARMAQETVQVYRNVLTGGA